MHICLQLCQKSEGHCRLALQGQSLLRDGGGSVRSTFVCFMTVVALQVQSLLGGVGGPLRSEAPWIQTLPLDVSDSVRSSLSPCQGLLCDVVSSMSKACSSQGLPRDTLQGLSLLCGVADSRQSMLN